MGRLQLFIRFAIGGLAVALMISPCVWSQTRQYTIQIASTSTEAEAEIIIEKLKSEGLDAYWVKAEIESRGIRYRVRTGRFSNQIEARREAERQLRRGLIKDYFLTVYEPVKTEKPLIVEKNKPAVLDPVDSGKVVDSTDKPPEPVSTPLKNEPVIMNRIETAHLDRVVHALTSTSKAIEASINIAAASPAKPSQSSDKDPADQHAIADPMMADSVGELSIANPNWKVINGTLKTDKNLRSIFFVDAMTGWVAGDSGTIFRTNDGGRTWRQLLSGSSASINFIFFSDWNYGWMLGEQIGRDGSGDGNEGETLLFMTTNGGKTWKFKPMPNVLSLCFTDHKNGWATGKNGTLLRTTDGGEEWKSLENIQNLVGLPVESTSYTFGFNDIQFIDAEHGWATGNFYGRARNNIGGLFVTSDAGETWKKVTLNLQTLTSSARFTPGQIHSVRFTDLKTGTVTGEMNDGEGRYFFVLHTNDGGATWEQFRSPSRATHQTRFLDLSNGWTAAFAQREGSADAVIYDTSLMRTDNGGISWHNDFLAKGRKIRSLYFLSTYRGWAAGDRGLILKYEARSKMN